MRRARFLHHLGHFDVAFAACQNLTPPLRHTPINHLTDFFRRSSTRSTSMMAPVIDSYALNDA